MAEVKSVDQVREELLAMLSVAMEEWQDLNGKMDQEVTTVDPDFRIVYQESGFFEQKLELPSTTESFAAFVEKHSFEFSASVDIPLNPKLIRVEKFSEIFEALKDIKNLVEKCTIYSNDLAQALLESIRPVIGDLQGLMFPLHQKLQPVSEAYIRQGFENLQQECKHLHREARKIFPEVSVTLSSNRHVPSKPLRLSINRKVYQNIDKFVGAFQKKSNLRVSIDDDVAAHPDHIVVDTGVRAPLEVPRNGTGIGVSHKGSLIIMHVIASRASPLKFSGQELTSWTLAHDRVSRGQVLVKVLAKDDS